jgi:hypothetical protein
MKLNNWSTTFFESNPYQAPETKRLCLQGFVTSHPRLDPEGVLSHKKILTSPIVRIEGRTVTTLSGSSYELGNIDPSFRAWLRENRPEWDHRNPITSLAPHLGEQ